MMNINTGTLMYLDSEVFGL